MSDNLYLSILNNPDMKPLTAYLLDRIDTAKTQVETVYVEEIEAGEYNQEQLDHLQEIFVILGEEKVRGYASQVQFMLMYTLESSQAYLAFGYDSTRDLLDAFGLPIAKGGRLTQLLGLAVEIVPWCMDQKLQVAGQDVTPAFFARFIEGKCLVSRARGVISRLRAIIGDATLKTQKKRVLVAEVLADLLDASITHEGLGEKHALNAPDAFSIAVYQRNGKVRLEVDLEVDQFEYIRRKAGKVVHFEFYPEAK